MMFCRTLKVYGASDKRSQLEPLLIWATPRQRGFPPRSNNGTPYTVPGAPADSGRGSSSTSAASAAGASSQHRSGMTAAQKKAAAKQQEALQKAMELKQMLNNLEKVDDEGRRSSLLDTLCSTEDVLNLPLHPDPPGIKNGNLVVDLLKHQVRVWLYNALIAFPL
jgi:SWI/SNF-related matrix-associated actin-dependent regulator of chromatin subfamily A3